MNSNLVAAGKIVPTSFTIGGLFAAWIVWSSAPGPDAHICGIGASLRACTKSVRFVGFTFTSLEQMAGVFGLVGLVIGVVVPALLRSGSTKVWNLR